MLGRNKGQQGERSAAERAAAAAERARRRGEAPPPLPVFDPEAGPEQAEPHAAPAEVHEPAPEPDEPSAVAEAPAPEAESEPEPATIEPAHAQPEPDVHEPDGHEPPVATDPEPAWHETVPDEHDSGVSWFEPQDEPVTDAAPARPEPVHAPHVDPEPEEAETEPAPEPERATELHGSPVIPRSGRRAAPPISPRPAPQRRAAPPRPGGGRGGGPRRPKAPKRPVPAGARPPSRTGRRVLALAVLLILGVGAWAAIQTFQPFHGDPRGLVRVKIPAGADAGTIGTLLEDRSVVASGRFFSVNATVTGRRGNLVAGTYTLQRDMSYGAVLDVLGKGPKAVKLKTFKLTVPEGLSIAETAGRVDDDIDGSYKAAADAPAARRRARKLGLPAKAKTTEGFLFPATFDLVNGASATDLVAKQLDSFAAQTANVGYARAKRRGLSRYEVLIVASMVERETRLDKERPLVAAVIYNRLRQGMPLGIDATIRYAEGNWTRPLKQSELQRPGPYNTRLNRGLPPTPIGNPGVKSIEAAARPASVGFLYYVVKPGTQGHAFSSTEAQFSRDVERYNQARDANGGNAP